MQHTYIICHFCYTSLSILKTLLSPQSNGYDCNFQHFRWKGENVATTEVVKVLNEMEGVLEASVYGVPIEGTTVV